MKKIMMIFAWVVFPTLLMSQESELPIHKHSVSTRTFWSNWFVSAGVDFNAVYSSQDHLHNKNPFSTDRGTFGFNVAVGKWFTPGIGLRTKFNGAWTKRVLSANNHHTFHYWNMHEDVMLNLSNLLMGYKEQRVWNLIPYVGVGVARNMSDNQYSFSGNVGLLNNFRVSKRMQIFLDLSFTTVDGSFDHAPADPWAATGNLSMRHWDKHFGASVGITYNIGKPGWEKTPDVTALMAMNKEQMDALNASLREQQNENARLREMLNTQSKPQPTALEKEVVVLAGTSQSVFFNIGSSRIASRKDLVNVKEVAEYAKQHHRCIVVTGYADSKTGDAHYNQQLSERRARVVADELVKMGVPAENIIVEAKGGVNMISPFTYNRRATVQLK